MDVNSISTLKLAGRKALEIRRSMESTTDVKMLAILDEEYEHQIKVIDEIVYDIKLRYPEQFWKDGSDEYRNLTEQWEAFRKRKNKKKAANK